METVSNVATNTNDGINVMQLDIAANNVGSM